MNRWTSERDFVAQYVLPRFKEAARVLGVSDLLDFHLESRVDGGTADLHAERAGKRLIVLEAKFKKKSGKVERDIESRDPDVIKQAVDYAIYGGFPFYLTCNTKRIVMFQLQPGKRPYESELLSLEFESEQEWAEEILKVTLGQVSVRLKPLDDTLVDTLHEAFRDLYPEFLFSLKERLNNGNFREKYSKWLSDQGLQLNDETNRLIAEQSSYLQINKLLFYQVIRTIYPDRLDELRIGEDEDVFEALSKFYEQAKKIDYAPVYESDVISEIPLTVRAKERFRTLIDTLREFDFLGMQSDFLGRVYEKLIPPAERKRLGQFYTPPDIVKLIVSLTVKDPNSKILDPGCGSGSFLVRSYHRLKELKGMGEAGPLTDHVHREILSQLYGIDINQFPAHLSVINLSVQNPRAAINKINVAVTDFFNVQPGQRLFTGFEGITVEGETSTIELPETLDVIVANPPYIRQELLGDGEKKKIRKTVEREYRNLFVGTSPKKTGKNKIVLDRQSDIYIYFFIHSLSFLRNCGRLGFISSNKWLEVGYGEPFQEFLLKYVKISYVIEFDRAVFPDAEVNTCVTILEKEEDQKAREENSVRFVRLKQKLTIDEAVRILEIAEESYEDEKVRVNVVKQGSSRSGKWNIYLRAPPVYQKIVSHPKMKPLGEVAEVFYGVKTGYNDYFILDEDGVKEWGIEKEFLVPCVSSPKKVKGLIIKPEDVKEYFFMVAENQVVPKDSNTYKYIEYGEKLEVEVTRGSQKGKRKLPDLETVKGRKKWYCLPRFDTPKILLPYMIDSRLRAWFNQAEAHAVDVIHYIALQEKNSFMLLGYLNSTIGALLAELFGRAYGGGVLKLQVYELKQMPVLSPSLLDHSEANALKDAFEEA